MKRCPECGRDYNDDSLSFCLDDGSELLFGPSSTAEPATAILASAEIPSEPPTRLSLETDRTTGQDVSASDLRRWIAPVVGLLIITLVGLGYFGYKYSGSLYPPMNSIAVLPFANATGNKETDFLSDGIAETLINSFTKIPELKVAARTSAFRFRGREGEPREIGRELGVGSILTGTVQRQGDSVRVQVDLINTSDGSQMWGNRYDGKVDEIVSIQQNILTDVASRLKLTSAQAKEISKTYTQNSEAYQHYLRGRYYWNRRTGENLKLAMREFQQAAEIDENYALAYVGLADCYVLLGEYGGVSQTETLPKAKIYADKARALDGNLAEVYATLGLINQKLWQWKESETAFNRAIELNPNYPTTYHWYAIMLKYMGRMERSHEMIEKAAKLDPLSLIIRSNLAISLRDRNQPDASLAECRSIQALDANFVYADECFGATYILLGRFDDAIAAYEKFAAAQPDNVSATAYLGGAYARAGRRDDARKQIDRLEKMFATGSGNAFYIAQVYSALEENDQAFAWIEKALNRREETLPGIVDDQFFKFIRDDPRYGSVIARMGIR